MVSCRFSLKPIHWPSLKRKFISSPPRKLHSTNFHQGFKGRFGDLVGQRCCFSAFFTWKGRVYCWGLEFSNQTDMAKIFQSIFWSLLFPPNFCWQTMVNYVFVGRISHRVSHFSTALVFAQLHPLEVSFLLSSWSSWVWLKLEMKNPWKSLQFSFAWWFGTWILYNFICSPRVGMMIQSDELHHFSGQVGIPPISHGKPWIING